MEPSSVEDSSHVTCTISESSMGPQDETDCRSQEEEELQRLSHLKCSLRDDDLKAQRIEFPFSNGKKKDFKNTI